MTEIDSIRDELANLRDRLEAVEPFDSAAATIVTAAAGALTTALVALNHPDVLLRWRPAPEPAPEPSPAEPDKVPDLMAALEESVAAAKEARSRHPRPTLTGRVRSPGGDLEGTVDDDAGHGPHDGDVFIEWDDGESGWYDADTVERIP